MGRTATGSVLLGLAVTLWAGSFWGTEIAARHSSATMLSGIRCLIALGLLAILLAVVRSRLPGGRLWIWSFVTGVLMVTLFFLGLAEGTARAGPANASVLANTTPLFVLVLAFVFLRERAARLGVLGLALGFAGVVVMVTPQLGGERDTGALVVGLVWALLAAFAWASGTLIVKWLLGREPGLDMVGLTGAQYLVGTPILLVVGFATGGAGDTSWGSGELWGSLAFLAIGPSVIATVAYFFALRHVSATTASAWTLLTPPLAVLIEIGRGRTPEAIVGVGMALAVAGVALVTLAPTLAARRATPTAVGARDAAV